MTLHDPMWTEFEALWRDLPIEHNQVLLAGGYGLFLKQRWLIANPDTPTVVAIRDWQDATPRVTKDMDFVLGLELLASRATQGQIADVMSKNGFKTQGKSERWQFIKELSPDHSVIVDWHAELPGEQHVHLELDKIRVKHKPSLGSQGVHGRQNPEAAGCEIHPFAFELGAMRIVVPNPVTWGVMKVVSAGDRWRKSQENRPSEYREFHYAQAVKHARDVMKIGAMTTPEEGDRAAVVIEQIKNTSGFIRAQEVWRTEFGKADSWASRASGPQWRPGDWEIVHGTISEWFK